MDYLEPVRGDETKSSLCGIEHVDWGNLRSVMSLAKSVLDSKPVSTRYFVHGCTVTSTEIVNYSKLAQALPPTIVRDAVYFSLSKWCSPNGPAGDGTAHSG